MAFLDIDEFLVFKGPGGALRSLPQLLLSYQEFSGALGAAGVSSRVGWSRGRGWVGGVRWEGRSSCG